MAAQKCKNILLQEALKDFWSSANLKLKKLVLSRLLTSLGSCWRKCKNWHSWELLLFANYLKYCSTVSFQNTYLWRSANLWKAWKSFDDFIKSSDLALGILLQWLAFLWTSNDWIVWSVAHNLIKFLLIALCIVWRNQESSKNID